MGIRFVAWTTYFLDFSFFAGIVGCASVVVFSWIFILKDGFSKEE